MSRVTGLVTAAIMATLVVAVGVATAHEKKFESEVTIAHGEVPGPDALFGEVNSNKGACQPGRTIKVFWRQSATPEKAVYTATSDASGQWSVSDQDFLTSEGQRFYAVVRRRVLLSPGHRHVCKRDTSPTITTHEIM